MNDTAAPEKTWLNGLLFVLTALTACVAGILWSASFLAAAAGPAGVEDLAAAANRALGDPRLFPLSALYAIALLVILVGHELGHYLTCRHYGLQATLPYFLPGPPFLGTFGAFIRVKSPILFKRQVFDVGANGPLAGFVLALPVLAVGMSLSKVIPYVPGPHDFDFGEPVLFRLLSLVFFGQVPEGSALVLHPVGWAGWVGLLVTGLNLLPFGQLDGGHVAYALLGRKTRLLSRIMFGVLVLLAVFTFWGWLFWVAIILIVALRLKGRPSHSPVLDEGAPLGPKRRVLAVVIVLIFFFSFIPDLERGKGLLDVVKALLGPG